MLVTNLLDRLVQNGERMARICAIYDNKDILLVALTYEDGTIDTVKLNECKFIHEKVFSVVAFWSMDQKIRMIKTIREHQGMDLKTAKDYVEANYGKVVVKGNLTVEEAEEIKRRVRMEGFECEVRKDFV